MSSVKVSKHYIRCLRSLCYASLLGIMLSLSACSAETSLSHTPISEPDTNYQSTPQSTEAADLLTEYIVYGNTIGNISNGGLAVECDETVYYIRATGGVDVKLGEIIQVDKLEKNVIPVYSGSIPRQLNAIDGRLYFIGSDDLIYTIGAGEPHDVQAVRLGELGPTKSMIIAGDHLYCISIDNDMIWYIYRLNTGTGEHQELAEIGKVTSGLAVSDNWIYYSCGDGGAWSCFRVRINGGKPEKIADVQLYSPCLANGKLYYLGTGTKGQPQIYIMDADGSNNKALGLDAVALNSDGEWLYYSDTNAVYRAKPDGTEQTILCNLPSSFDVDINLIDGWAYVTGSGTGPYWVSTEGDSVQKLP